MPRTECIAKKDFEPLFKKGDKVTVVPVLYEEDTQLHGEIFGVFTEKGELYKIAEPIDILKRKGRPELRKISEPLIAPKGSYKDSYIELEDGRQYPGSYFRRYEDYFEKIS